MTTTRELCRVLSAAIHLPSVDRWAEQLVSRELLPGLDHEVCALDAALLLMAVVAAPNPEDAARVVVTLANLPRMSTMRCVDGPEIETWARCTDADVVEMPSDPLNALAVAIEQEPFPDNRFYFRSVRIEENGASAELLGWFGDEGNYETHQQSGPGAEISWQALCERGAAGRDPAMETMAGDAVMSGEMAIPAAIHKAKGTLNEPSSITDGSVARRRPETPPRRPRDASLMGVIEDG